MVAGWLIGASAVLAGTFEFGSNNTDVSIPDGGGWISSTITINNAPAGAVVTGIDVYFRCVHPYSGDLNIDLNADPQGSLGNYDLWAREGGGADNPSRTVNGITTFNGLSANRTWYLYARDEEPLDAGYIDEWWIRVYYDVEQDPPPPPSLVSPGSPSAPGPEISDLTPTMQWSSSSGATGYGFYISRNDSGTWNLIFDSETAYGGAITGTSRTLPGGVLTDGEMYRWNMRATNDAGWGSFSNRFYFTTESTEVPPPPPALVSPGSPSAPGPEISDLTPTIQWSSSSGATGYGFYISRNDSGTWNLIFDSETAYGGAITGTSRTLPGGVLTDGEMYRWNMRATNDAGWGSFSNRFYFTTESTEVPPPPPVLVSPGSPSAPGPEISDLTPTIQWSSSSGATGYGFYISRNDSGTWNLIFDSETAYGGAITGTSRTLPGGVLTDGEMYRWNMRATNDAGWGSFSDRFYFTTEGGGGGADGTFQWPIENPQITQAYAHEAAAGRHTALDIISSSGSTVITAAGAGTARVVPQSTYPNNNHNMGNVVVIDHNNGKGPFSLYAHLSNISIGNGQTVVAGQPIGVMGATGCDGCGIHLHFEVKQWDVLGSLDDDQGPDWGYVDEHPNLHGYINPWPYLEFDIPFLAPQPVMSLVSQTVLTGPDPVVFETSVTEVDSGQMFSAFGEYSGWYQIFLPGNHGPANGWIQATPVNATQVPVVDPERGIVGISVRGQPTSSSTRLGYVWDAQWLVEQEQSSPGGGCSSNWSRIDLGENLGTLGWVCGDFLGSGSVGETPLFADGFESGDTSGWSATSMF